jgi:hypothetical protein
MEQGETNKEEGGKEGEGQELKRAKRDLASFYSVVFERRLTSYSSNPLCFW